MSFRDEVIRYYESGEARADLRAHERDWKRQPTSYVLANVVGNAIAEDRADDLYEVLLDADFRALRLARFGLNDLREDLRAGRDYFSGRHPDLLRYIKITSVEEAASDDPESIRAHLRHCQSFADFLQLDRLPAERLETGLHRILGRCFPITGAVTVRLFGYDLGTWRCSCGFFTGLSQRYRHHCPCGALAGNGRLHGAVPPCSSCKSPAAYATCPDCGTRVTLENLWRLRHGDADRSAYQVRLTLHLSVEGTREEDTRIVHFPLMDLPIPIGLQEHDGSIGFTLPDMMWLGGRTREPYRDAPVADPYLDGHFVLLKDVPGYDGRSDLLKILEAALRRALCAPKEFRTTSRGGYAYFHKEMLERLASGGPDSEPISRFTDGFEYRIAHNIVANSPRPEDLVRFADLSAMCTVATSGSVPDNTVLVNRRLTDLKVLSAPYRIHLRSRIRAGAELTGHPPETYKRHIALLDSGGIVRPGQEADPGQVLVGIARPVLTRREMTPEERLLAALFEQQPIRDESLVLSGSRPARIVAQSISTREDVAARIPPAQGRYVTTTGFIADDVARFVMTAVVDHALEAGDTLLGPDGSSALVCGVAGGPVLRQRTGSALEPDLVVAPGHPWAPTADGATHQVRVRLKIDSHASRSPSVRTDRTYVPTTGMPPHGVDADGFAHAVTPSEFAWLTACGAKHLPFELSAYRCDCPDLRLALYEALVYGDGSVQAPDNPASQWTSLRDSPSEAIRQRDRLLIAARIKSDMADGKISLRLMTDAEVLAESQGEITASHRWAAPPGLGSVLIFGPRRWGECACGTENEVTSRHSVCEACGSRLLDPGLRRHRMGHIELPMPVLHSWYLHSAAGAKVAAFLALPGGAADLREIADCVRFVVVDPASTPLRHGQVISAHELATTRRKHPDAPIRALTGGEAVEFLIQQSEDPKTASPLAERIVLRRIPVSPPDLRSFENAEGTFFSSDANVHYQHILAEVYSSADIGKERHLTPHQQLFQRRRLQHSVDALFQNALSAKPRVDNSGHTLVSIIDQIRSMHHPAGSLREGLSYRPVDYSASTRLVVSPPVDGSDQALDLDTSLLPTHLAWGLFEPLVIAALVQRGVEQNIQSAKRAVQKRAANAFPVLEAVCTSAVILVAIPHGPWPIVALRVRLTNDSVLHVHSGLLDHVGWSNIGQRVRVFSVLTREAVKESTELLAPTFLKNAVAVPNADIDTATSSLFDLSQESLADELARAALDGQVFDLAGDGLVLCDRDWCRD